MKLKTRDSGEVRILELHGKLVLGEPVDTLGKTTKGLIDEGHNKIVVSLKGVEYVDSAGIGELVAARRYRPKPPPRPGAGYKVIHEERDLLVVEKQPRLLSVPTPLRQEEDSLVERLLESERARGVRRPALYALHRLDWDTSGLLLFARSRRAYEALEAQFQTRTIERLYTAVAAGRVEPDEGRFESRLVEDPRTLKVRSTRRPGEGKEAITE